MYTMICVHPVCCAPVKIKGKIMMDLVKLATLYGRETGVVTAMTKRQLEVALLAEMRMQVFAASD